MIITLGGIKGGSGKTTAATNLAVLRAAAGREVVLVDADEQCSAADFSMLRDQEVEGGAGYLAIRLRDRAVRTETRKLAQRYDDVIIDTGGRGTKSQWAALAVSDVLLVPLVPGNYDVWSLQQTAEVVAEVRDTSNPDLVALAFLNRAESRGPRNAEAAALVEELPEIVLMPTPLGRRVAFAQAAERGLAVTEISPQTVSARKAADEITALAGHLETYENGRAPGKEG